MRFFASALALLAGLALLGYGIAQLTVWAPPESVTVLSDQLEDAPLTVVSQDLAGPDSEVDGFRIEAEGPYTIALGRVTDVMAWVDDAAHIRIGSLHADEESPRDAQIAVERTDGARRVPDPADSDLWAETQQVEGPLEYRWSAPRDSQEWALLMFRDGSGPAPSRVSLELDNPRDTAPAVAAIVGGGVLTVLAIVLFYAGLTRYWRRAAIARTAARTAAPARTAGAGPVGTTGPSGGTQPAQHVRRRSQAVLAGAIACSLALSAEPAAPSQPQSESPPHTESPPNPDASAEGPVLRPERAADARPSGDRSVLLDVQLRRILKRIAANAEEADREQDADLLGDRIAGSARKARALAYRNAAADGEGTVVPIGQEVLSAAVTSFAEWPRHAIVFTGTETSDLPQALVLEQASAREPYRLREAVEMIPGAEVPALDAEEGGVEPIAVDDAHAALAADEALHRTAAYLDDRAHESAADVADNPYIEQFQDYQDELAQTAVDVVIGYERRLKEDGALAMRLPDGSVLAVGAVDARTRLDPVEAGASADFGDTLLGHLAGTVSTTAAAEIRNRETMLLHIAEGEAEEDENEEDENIVMVGVHDIVEDVVVDP